MKKLLIIGAGFLQSFIIKKARDMGYYTIAIDKNPNADGFDFADEFAAVDIIDQESCLKYAKEKSIDGVITAATDYGVLSAAYVARELCIPGLNYDVARIIKNKYKIRQKLSESKTDDFSQFYEVNSLEDLNEIKDSITYPVMVKPCDGSGSKAVKRVGSYAELLPACEAAMASSLTGKALIEDFIVGKEYGVESFVYNSQVYVLGVMGKHMTAPPDYAELGHCFPSGLPIEDKVKKVVESSIKALGINFGAVNMDVLISEDYRVHIVDVGARMGGNLIGSHIIPIGTGFDYMGNLIRAAAGDVVDLTAAKSDNSIATRILALTPGKVEGLPDFDQIKKDLNVDIYCHLKVGDDIHKYHNNLDGCGYVVAVANHIEEAERRANKAKEIIDSGIKRF